MIQIRRALICSGGYFYQGKRAAFLAGCVSQAGYSLSEVMDVRGAPTAAIPCAPDHGYSVALASLTRKGMDMSDPKDKLNPDPITGEPGAHPVGTGLGATGGAIAGAAAGLVGGPIGVAVGTVVGAVIGGFAGKEAAEVANPTEHDAYWREAHTGEPYYLSEYTYDEYGPAYRAGYEARFAGTDWDATRAEWARRWDAEHADGKLKWEKAEPAVKAAWERANRAYVQETGS